MPGFSGDPADLAGNVAAELRFARDALASAAERSPRDPVAQLFLFQAAVALQERPLAERALVALERYAPARNQDQVVEARRRLGELP